MNDSIYNSKNLPSLPRTKLVLVFLNCRQGLRTGDVQERIGYYAQLLRHLAFNPYTTGEGGQSGLTCFKWLYLFQTYCLNWLKICQNVNLCPTILSSFSEMYSEYQNIR